MSFVDFFFNANYRESINSSNSGAYLCSEPEKPSEREKNKMRRDNVWRLIVSDSYHIKDKLWYNKITIEDITEEYMNRVFKKYIDKGYGWAVKRLHKNFIIKYSNGTN